MLLSHSRVQIGTRLAEIRKKNGPVFERTPFLGLPTLSPFSAVTHTCQLHTLSLTCTQRLTILQQTCCAFSLLQVATQERSHLSAQDVTRASQ